MDSSAQPQNGGRGVDLLLRHCSALDGLDEHRPTAYERLVAAVGDDLARMLVSALARDRGTPSRSPRLYAA